MKFSKNMKIQFTQKCISILVNQSLSLISRTTYFFLKRYHVYFSKFLSSWNNLMVPHLVYQLLSWIITERRAIGPADAGVLFNHAIKIPCRFLHNFIYARFPLSTSTIFQTLKHLYSPDVVMMIKSFFSYKKLKLKRKNRQL